MSEILTRAEIQSQFESEWVLVEDPVLDEHLDVVQGKVACHSRDRDEVDRRAIELQLPHAAYLFTGNIPDDVAVVPLSGLFASTLAGD